MRIPRNERLGSDIAESAPERKCVLSGEHDARDDLVRLAISPEGEVLPDALARAPGRGAWIGVSRAELEAAIAKGKLKGALARAFKGAPISVPEDLGARTEAARTQVAAAERRAQLVRESRGFFDKSFRLGESDLPTRLRIEAEAADADRQAARARIELAASISAWRQALGLLPQ